MYHMSSAGLPRLPAGNPSRTALACAFPAILLGALLLLPFLKTPFTIDDPLYLAEAQHALEDPLHPLAVDIVWSFDVKMRASSFSHAGVAVPFLLAPAVLAGNAEWVAHLTELICLAIGLFATSLLALRLGLDRRSATIAALIAGSAPAVIGMAGTAMPDVPAMMFTVLGMERIVALRDGRKWHQGLLAVLWLTLAALTRLQTIFFLAPALVFLLDGISLPELRSSFRTGAVRFLALAAVVVLVAAAVWITTEADPPTDIIAFHQTAASVRAFLGNVCAFFAHWLLTVPFTVAWLLIRRRKIPRSLAILAMVGGTIVALQFGWVGFALAATALAMCDLLFDAVCRQDRIQLGLGLCLLPALSLAIYLHLPCKYIVPSIPMAAILMARALPAASLSTQRWLPAGAVLASVGLSLLVLLGIRDLARSQQLAAKELVTPRVLAGERVWFAGHWGFHWYAEAAGARPAVWLGEVPQPGDTVVVAAIDDYFFARNWQSKQVTGRFPYDSAGRVMDRRAGAGFFSNGYGYLPWAWSKGEANVFEIWKIE
jgi:4-amino-4-deoxy-L-arabinose transferase-like glycosyltransferase